MLAIAAQWPVMNAHTGKLCSAWLQQAGFAVQSQTVMYRGYSHYSVCKIAEQ